MLYKNLKLDIITKFPFNKEIQNLKCDCIKIHFTNNSLTSNNKLIYPMIEHSISLTTQIPKLLLAKKSNSAFNVRKHFTVSLITTLRNNIMLNMLKKLTSTIIPNNKKSVNLKYNNQKNKLVYNLGFDKLKLLPDLNQFNNHNNKEGFHLEVIITSKFTKEQNNIRIFMMNGILSNGLMINKT